MQSYFWGRRKFNGQHVYSGISFLGLDRFRPPVTKTVGMNSRQTGQSQYSIIATQVMAGTFSTRQWRKQT